MIDFVLKEKRVTNPFRYSILVNVALFGFVLFLGTPGFETNDDAAMMMFSSGYLTGEPSEYLILTNICVGFVLKHLYRTVPSFNWYVIFLYSTHFVSMVFICWAFTRQKRSLLGLSLFLAVFVLFETALLVRLQFTATGFVAGVAGALVFMECLETEMENRAVGVVVALLLFMIAGLVRWQVLYGVLLVFSPTLFFALIEKRQLLIPMFLLSLLVIFWTIGWFEEKYYLERFGTPSFLEYQKAVEVLANDPLAVSKESLEAVGWHGNDLRLFKQWFWVDKETFSRERVIRFSELVRSHRDVWSSCAYLFRVFRSEAVTILYGAICLLVPFFCVGKGRRYVIATVLTAITVFVGLGCFSRLPHRVFFPLVFFLSCLSLRLVLRAGDMESLRSVVCPRFILFMSVIAMLLLVQGYRLFAMSSWNKTARERFEKAEEEIFSEKNKLFVVRGGTFPFEGIPLFTNPVEKGILNMLPTGWASNTPVFDDVLKRFTITNLTKALFERDDICIVGGSEAFRGELKEFIRRHYDTDVIFQECREKRDLLSAIRVMDDGRLHRDMSGGMNSGSDARGYVQ